MKKYLFRITFVLIACLQASAETSVWKAEKAGAVMYLGGTCHLLRPTDFPLPPEFDRAYQASGALIFETDLGKMKEPAFQAQLMSLASYADGSTIDQHLSPAVYTKLSDYCVTQGIPLPMLKQFKPSLLAIFIMTTELSKMGVTQEGVDQFFYKQAMNEGKPVRGLESIEQQLNFVVTLGEGKEDAMMMQTLEDMLTLKQDYEALVSAWKTGDEDGLNTLMNNKLKTTYPEIYQDLIVDRNQNWLPAVEACQKTPETEFILVGAAHLVGPDGLIEALKKAGYTVEKL